MARIGVEGSHLAPMLPGLSGSREMPGASSARQLLTGGWRCRYDRLCQQGRAGILLLRAKIAKKQD